MKTLEDIGGLHGGDVLREYLAAANIVADYIVSARPNGYQAISLSDQPSFSHATDPAVAAQGAINTLGTNGGTILLAGNLPWGSVPALPRSITGKPLAIRGAPGAKVTLSAAAPRLFDFNKVADYDTFQNIEVSDLTVDVNNVGGQHHIIMGAYIGGSSILRLNFDKIAVRRVRVLNVPTDPTLTNHRRGIHLVTLHAASGEGTQTTVKNILIEDYRQEGGNAAIEIAGTATGALATGCNTFVDNIIVNRWYHDLGSVQSSGFASSNVQIGGRGQLGSCYVGNGYGRGSGDIAIEIDCPRSATVENVVIEDSFQSGLYFGNYTSPANTSENTFVARNVVHRKVASTSAASRLLNIFVNGTVNIPCGQVELNNCKCYQHTAEAASVPGWAVNIGDTASAGLEKLTIRDCHFTSDAISTSSNFSRSAISCSSRGTTCAVVIDNVWVKQVGTVSANTLTDAALSFGNGSFVVRVDGLFVDSTLTGNAASAMQAVNLAASGSTTTIKGTFKNVNILNLTGGASNRGFVVRGTGFLTIPAGQIIAIENCDLRGATSGNEILMVNDTAIQTAVVARTNAWTTVPAPTTLTGLVTATGKALGTKFDCIAVFTPGSGAGITAIDVSTNGGTTYTNVLTQASAAMPAGLPLKIGPVPASVLIKVTFATTQPTINLIPVNP